MIARPSKTQLVLPSRNRKVELDKRSALETRGGSGMFWLETIHKLSLTRTYNGRLGPDVRNGWPQLTLRELK